MSIQIVGFKTVTALHADAQPELDDQGFPVDQSITRAYTPVQYPRAMDGLVGGHDEDPLESGYLGSRWYQLGEAVGSTFSMSGSRLTVYRDELLEFSDGAGEGSAFDDLIHFDSADGIIGPDACKRLAADYKRHPFVHDQTQVHSEINSMIHEIAEHGGCLVFEG
jgi:hypothetical protein